MKTQIGVVQGLTVFKVDVVTDLKAEAVAIVLSCCDTAKGEAMALLQEHGASVVAVDLLVLLAVAIEHELFDDDIADTLGGGEDGEQGRCRGLSIQPEILLRTSAQGDFVAVDGDHSATDDVLQDPRRIAA